METGSSRRLPARRPRRLCAMALGLGVGRLTGESLVRVVEPWKGLGRSRGIGGEGEQVRQRVELSAESIEGSATAPQPGRPLVRRLALVVVVAVAVAGGWWAGRVTTLQASTPEPEPTAVITSVVDGSVGRTLQLNATVTQPFVLVASNTLLGVVTAVGDGSAQLGGVLFEVAGTPVWAVQGTRPFYRDLAAGAVGEDVRQLQEALVGLGYMAPGAVDGRFGSGTSRAVQAWQKAIGRSPTGTVMLGEVVAFPTLPTTYRLGESVQVGGLLSGGEEAVLAATGEARFSLVLTSEQAALVPTGSAVAVSFQNRVWPARVAGSTVREDGNLALELIGSDGGPVCGADCGLLPAQETQSLLAAVQVVPAVSGPAIPAAAVRTGDDGTTYVNRPDGSRVEVVVLASGDGLAVVDGLVVGEKVVVLEAGSSTGDEDGQAEH